jgi:DNA-binding GntR family transcriptional regulator
MIKHLDLSQQAYIEIKKQIFNRDLKPGQKLAQDKIASKLGISKMPLHKALQMLESELLVEFMPRRGYIVKDYDRNEQIDAFECREVLEGLAARKLAKNPNHKEIANKLYAIFEPFKNNPVIDKEAYRLADQNFHNTICELSNNSVLKKLDVLGNYLVLTYSYGLVRQPKETLIEHFEIIEAIREGNSKKAEKVMRKHTSNSIDIMK